MLSALIPAQLSYPAMFLAEQLVYQRLVQPDPLVQRPTPLKTRRLQQIETNLSHAYFSPITKCMDYITFHQNFLDVLMEDRRIMEGYLPSSARKQKVSTASSIKLKLPRCYPNR